VKISDSIDPAILMTIAPRKKLTANVLTRLRQYEVKRPQNGLHDEQVWTLLVVYGYALDESNMGQRALTKALIGLDCNPKHVWFEMLPLPPRKGIRGNSERNTEVDIVLGDVAIRGQSKSGIEFDSTMANGWVCFVEAKWLCDISSKTTNDQKRNQFVRIIENGLTFQGNLQYPGRIHVTLLTPACFKTDRCAAGSRLYSYKWHEYTTADGTVCTDSLMDDIENCCVSQRPDSATWKYPSIRDRATKLSLHWRTFEDLIKAMPQTDYKRQLIRFLDCEPRPLLLKAAYSS
jgi:hypothetical protein